MPIERFLWTEHAGLRLDERRLTASEVEQAIHDGHVDRQVNDGRAEWLVSGKTAAGTAFEAIYDHPHGGDDAAVRIVSVWRLDP
jgi:Domain of unknown function (DUF4258)